jgi:hypothetical protein
MLSPAIRPGRARSYKTLLINCNINIINYLVNIINSKIKKNMKFIDGPGIDGVSLYIWEWRKKYGY